MGFFEALRSVLADDQDVVNTLPMDRKLGDAWRLNDVGTGFEVGSGADDNSGAPTEGTSDYDRRQWEKKLKRLLDELPDARPRWDDLMLEARALGLDPDWVSGRQREEFALLIRRVVADCVVSEEEHRKLELARELIGIPTADAEADLRAIVAEARTFFSKPVVEGGSPEAP